MAVAPRFVPAPLLPVCASCGLRGIHGSVDDCLAALRGAVQAAGGRASPSPHQEPELAVWRLVRRTGDKGPYRTIILVTTMPRSVFPGWYERYRQRTIQRPLIVGPWPGSPPVLHVTPMWGRRADQVRRWRQQIAERATRYD